MRIFNKKILILTAGSLAVLFYCVHNIKADDSSVDCSTLTGDAQDQCYNLEKKAKVYQELIDLKTKQQDTLNNQLQSLDLQQKQNEQKLKDTQSQVDDLSGKIDAIEKNILDKEDELNNQKKILADLMESYYEYDQQGILKLALADQQFFDTFRQADYLEQSNLKASDILAEIIRVKDDLTNQSNQLNQQMEQMNDLKGILTQRNSDLQDTQDQKQSLLQQTQGEEQKYQQLLANVELEKKQLFDFSSASNIGDLMASVASYPRPATNLASTSWYFSQLDSRWADKKIGNSNSTIGEYGCALTSLSMVFRKFGSSIDPGLMSRQKMFYYDLIEWPDSWDPGIALISSVDHGNVSWSKINSEIADSNPVIVHINKTNGQGGHYVVITGRDKNDYIVHDPYFGPNLYLGTSESLVGKIGSDSGVKIDQMIIYE